MEIKEILIIIVLCEGKMEKILQIKKPILRA